MQKKILVAPLNWGLGHASRMIPVIRELKKQGADVILAADGRPYELLRKEFPDLKCLRLGGYDIRYQQKGNFTTQILLQIPKIIGSYFYERKELKRIIRDEGIDAVISDNRFGLSDKNVFSVFVTHQICILMPKGWKWFEKILYHLNRLLIEKFDECWIPDMEGAYNLTGDLTRKYPLPKNAKFIGLLTRMNTVESKLKYDLLILLSGPEPQRSIIEELLRQQAKDFSEKMLMVRGIAERNGKQRIKKNFEVVDFMTSQDLNEAIASSVLVISRSGYSTVMDLAVMHKKAIFIPTPGQTEQEYLGVHLMQKGISYFELQHSFDLKRALKKSDAYKGFTAELRSDLHKHINNMMRLLSLRVSASDSKLTEPAMI
jgi:uncharacterized protein (TIGR00661 family)